MSATVHEASWRDAPGWDALESGLDVVFKALGVQVLLLALVAVTHIAPEAPGSRELFGWIRQIFGVFTLGATLWMALGVGRCRAVPQRTGARLPITTALLLTGVAVAAQGAWSVAGFLDSLPPAQLAGLRFVGQLALLAASASLLSGVARAAAGAGARPIVRFALYGQLALVVFLSLYAAAHLSGALAETETGGPWRTALWLLLVPVLGLTLFPIHRLARFLTRAASPPVPLEDVSLHDPYPVVRLDNRRRDRDDARPATEEDEHEERWVPRHERLLGLHVAPPPSPERALWIEARDGLRVYFGGLVARVAVALVASVAPSTSAGGGALTWFLALVIALGLASGSLAAALGAMRYARIPAASGAHGPARWAGWLSSLLFLGDLVILLVVVLAAADFLSPTATFVPGVLTGALMLVAPLVLAWSLARLGRTLGEHALARRARRIASLMPLLAAMLVGAVVLATDDATDVRGLATVLDLAIFVVGIILTVQQLHLVHDGAESIDDHVARLDRAAEDEAQRQRG
ncbi:MAG: hypothetical protein EP329_18450 [Deltaproteobacteria bacterium]|nr:MAG: hypothetical protein EP329_18450 [Deltaproteobacteria bacterium]